MYFLDREHEGMYRRNPSWCCLVFHGFVGKRGKAKGTDIPMESTFAVLPAQTMHSSEFGFESLGPGEPAKSNRGHANNGNGIG